MRNKVTIYSYKKAQHFKKDYIRHNGSFIKFEKSSANHKAAHFFVDEGDEFDARASIYGQGATKWDATKCQSWCKFKVENGEVIAMNYDGDVVDAPAWITVHKIETPVAS